MTEIRSARHTMLRKAIFTICGSREPSASCLADIGRRAAESAGRSKPWRHRHLYTLLHVDRYDATKYPITDELLNALLALSARDATNGKRVVKVYARHVRSWSVILMRSRKCKRPACRIHFVGLGDYCSNSCREVYRKHLRKLADQKRKLARLKKRRLAERSRRKQSNRRK